MRLYRKHLLLPEALLKCARVLRNRSMTFIRALRRLRILFCVCSVVRKEGNLFVSKSSSVIHTLVSLSLLLSISLSLDDIQR